MSVQILDFEARGAAKQLWLCPDIEVMLEGPAGTGKTRPVCQLVHFYAERRAGSRILICRKTRASLTESVLNTFQRITLAGHPAAEGADPAHRSHYDYPNGSRIVVGGLDTPERTFSTEYNLIWVEEASEITEDEAQSLFRALRWHQGTSRRQMIYTTNPSHPQHWLNVRANEGKIRRFCSRHQDNPRFWDRETGDWTEEGREYLAILNRLTGARRARLLLGQWAAAEGMVYESEWDQAAHVIPPNSPIIPRGKTAEPEYQYHVVGLDWGYTDPGCLQVWGVDGDGRMYLVHEVYRTGLGLGPHADGSECWFTVAQALQKRYKPAAWACDPARPEHIDQFRKHGIPAVGADNERETGIEAVRRRMVKAGDGQPRLFVVSDSLERRDPAIVAKGRPCGFVEEMPQYVYYTPPTERAIDDRTDPACADHAMDAARYACAWVDRYHMRREQRHEYPVGSVGRLLKHDAVWQEARRRQLRGE